jgi:hypothetical protein
MMSREERVVEHETAFVRSFIVPERRERWLAKLDSPKKRVRFLDRLNHQFRNDLDDRFLMDSYAQSPRKNSPLCYIIADEREYDGKLVSESEAEDILQAANFGIVVSFVPGRLACYKDEAPSDVIWMHRTEAM